MSLWEMWGIVKYISFLFDQIPTEYHIDQWEYHCKYQGCNESIQLKSWNNPSYKEYHEYIDHERDEPEREDIEW